LQLKVKDDQIIQLQAEVNGTNTKPSMESAGETEFHIESSNADGAAEFPYIVIEPSNALALPVIAEVGFTSKFKKGQTVKIREPFPQEPAKDKHRYLYVQRGGVYALMTEGMQGHSPGRLQCAAKSATKKRAACKGEFKMTLKVLYEDRWNLFSFNNDHTCYEASTNLNQWLTCSSVIDNDDINKRISDEYDLI